MLARRSPLREPWTKARKPTRSPTLERHPSQATRRMGKRLYIKRDKIKPFIKTINHLMPTRYTLERQPSQATRRMGKRLHAKRDKIKPFIKTINHLMPTRYTLELEGSKGLLVPLRPRRRNRAPPRQKSLVKGREQEAPTVTQVRKSPEPKC